MRNLLPGRIGIQAACAALSLAIPLRSNAVLITSTPTFTPSILAPLAGTLNLTTDVPSRVSVQVNDGTNIWSKDFYDLGTSHSETLLGFRPARSNQIQITVYDAVRNTTNYPQAITFLSPPLPSGFPTHTTLVSNPSLMEPGYTLAIIANQTTAHSYLSIFDNTGEVVWYYNGISPSGDDVRQLTNGDLFMPQTSGKSIIELNLLGGAVRTWSAASNFVINLHDAVPTPHGTILYLTDESSVEANFPTSVIPNAPTATTNVDYNAVVEISATNSSLLNTWSLLDMLDPYRLTYLTFGQTTSLGLDIQHANAVIEDPRDNSIIVSLREQNAIIKFSRATGKLVWILGPPEGWSPLFQQYLFTPTGPITWNFGQHAPLITPQGTLIFYDDGNARATPPNETPVPDSANYSSVVEYSLDETNMTVTQVWNSYNTNDVRLFTPIVGMGEPEPITGNVLSTFGYVTYINGNPASYVATNATMVRLREFTHTTTPQVVFDLSFFDPYPTNSLYKGYFCYRSHRIPDLYGHFAAPVVNLAVLYDSAAPHLEFSADPQFSYSVQASTDLVNWQTVGNAQNGDLPSDFDFYDIAPAASTRFYRVITQIPQ
jgi:arylsulfate sulfotransferase